MEVFSKIGLFCLIRQSKCFNWLVPVCSFTILNALVLVIHQISQSIIYVAPILSVILNVGSFWCCSLNDSRGGTLLLLLLLLFVNCYTSSHILYALYIFLCCCLLLIDRGTFREIIGLFDPPVLSFPEVSSSCSSHWFCVVLSNDQRREPTRVEGQQDRWTPVSSIQSETWSIMIPGEFHSPNTQLIRIPGKKQALRDSISSLNLVVVNLFIFEWKWYYFSTNCRWYSWRIGW